MRGLKTMRLLSINNCIFQTSSLHAITQTAILRIALVPISKIILVRSRELLPRELSPRIKSASNLCQWPSQGSGVCMNVLSTCLK